MNKMCEKNTFDNIRHIFLFINFSNVFESFVIKINVKRHIVTVILAIFIKDKECQRTMLTVDCIVNYFTNR